MKTKISKHRNNIIFVIISFFIFVSFIISFVWPFIPNNETEEDTSLKLEPKKEKEETTEILVDIKGQINSPGVYKMNNQERVNDVIKKAGGLTNYADTSMINLSQKVKDEMVIIIYSKKEVIEMNKKEPCICPKNNDACIDEKNKTEDITKDKENKKTNNKISINNATKEELMTLDGIGEAKAESILEYRKEKGSFEKVEDIQNVSGIGEALYEKIKNKIII